MESKEIIYKNHALAIAMENLSNSYVIIAGSIEMLVKSKRFYIVRKMKINVTEAEIVIKSFRLC